MESGVVDHAQNPSTERLRQRGGELWARLHSVVLLKQPKPSAVSREGEQGWSKPLTVTTYLRISLSPQNFSPLASEEGS